MCPLTTWCAALKKKWTPLFSGPFSHCLQCKWRSNSETAILTMPTISYDDAFTPVNHLLQPHQISPPLYFQKNSENRKTWKHSIMLMGDSTMGEMFTNNSVIQTIYTMVYQVISFSTILPNCNGTGIPGMYVHMIGVSLVK